MTEFDIRYKSLEARVRELEAKLDLVSPILTQVRDTLQSLSLEMGRFKEKVHR